MSDTDAAAFLDLVAGRRVHFRLESGHHSRMWLDLDALFASPSQVEPFVAALATTLRSYDVALVCGPLLGGAFLAQLVARELGAQFCFTERMPPSPDAAMYGVRYRLPSAFVERVRGRRIAMVDDVMSAGSALRGTYAELSAYGALPVVAAALLVLGTTGADFFAMHDVMVEGVAREEFDLWLPNECPLCAAGIPLQDIAVSVA